MNIERKKNLIALLKMDGVHSEGWADERQHAFNTFLHERLDAFKKRNSGAQTKHNGDGLFAVSPSASALAEFWLAMVEEIAKVPWPTRSTDSPLVVRSAFDVEEVDFVTIDDMDVDVSGAGAIPVARIEPIAPHGQLLCTEAAVKTFRDLGDKVEIDDLGSQTLAKNGQIRRLFSVKPNGHGSAKPAFNQQSRMTSIAGRTSDTSAFHAELLCETMCLHQGKLLEFFFLTAGKHKNLRQLVEKKRGNGTRWHRAVRDSEGALRGYMAQQLEAIYFQSFTTVTRFFDERIGGSPRICVKAALFQGGPPDVLSTVARSTDVAYENSGKFGTAISKNTGFSKCAVSRRYYHCNDLLLAALQGGYDANPRIDFIRLKEDRSKLLEADDANRMDVWPTYWDNGAPNDPSSCYRSTLIIPMTLAHNDLSHEFRKEFKLPDVGRTIFGFLCFDHPNPNYFCVSEVSGTRSSDCAIGYFFADLFSLYFVTALGFTAASRTYEDALRIAEVI